MSERGQKATFRLSEQRSNIERFSDRLCGRLCRVIFRTRQLKDKAKPSQTKPRQVKPRHGTLTLPDSASVICRALQRQRHRRQHRSALRHPDKIHFRSKPPSPPGRPPSCGFGAVSRSLAPRHAGSSISGSQPVSQAAAAATASLNK